MRLPLLEVHGLVKTFGGITANDNLSLDVEQGELHAVIGPNGAGKTTFIAQLAGMLAPMRGSIRFDGEDITALGTVARVRRGIARTFQITSLWPALSVLENVMVAVQAHQGHAFRFWERADESPTLRESALHMLQRVGLAAKAWLPAQALSHGEQRQLELAVTLATQPRLLLLDEPMAGMSGEDGRNLVRLLRELKGSYTILLVEHDMDAVFALADRISVLIYGRCVATGVPAAIRANPEVRAAYLGEKALR
jgi:branched-chain amino acid transport system ATP-binding protein